MDSPTTTETEKKGTQKEEVKTSVEKSAEDVKEETEEEQEEFYVETSFTHEISAEKPVEEEKQEKFANEEYIKTFENRTIDDFLKEQKEEEKKEEHSAEEEKPKDTRSLKEYFADLRRAKTQENQQEEKQPEKEVVEETKEEKISVIEKPNYDLLETDKKIIKISQKKKKKQKKSTKKIASIVLAIALGISGVICITNCVLIDQQYSAYIDIEETYQLNLQKYLRNISNLDATKKSMEVIETYPEEVKEAGDLGESSNWFNRICNFLSGLFGG